MALVSDQQINLADQITIAEFINLLKDIGIDTSQQIQVSEYVNSILTVAGVNVSEQITVTEFVNLLKDIGINIEENVTISRIDRHSFAAFRDKCLRTNRRRRGHINAA